MTEAPIDLEQVRREIEADVRARRARGDYPDDYERELDAVFARLSPPDVATDVDAALDRVEETIAIDPVIPIKSDRAAYGMVKRVVAKFIGWYHAFVAYEVTKMGVAIAQALRLLRGRVDLVERDVGYATRAEADRQRVVPERDDTAWSSRVIDALQGRRGRIAVCEAGAGDLVAALVAAGLDAYGVEPRDRLADVAAGRGLEVRADTALGHLRVLAPGDVDAVVLRACIEPVSAGEVIELLDVAASRLAPGHALVVCSVAPAAWGGPTTRVEADLARGRPLHAATWEALLEARNFTDVDARECGPDTFVVVAIRGNR